MLLGVLTSFAKQQQEVISPFTYIHFHIPCKWAVATYILQQPLPFSQFLYLSVFWLYRFRPGIVGLVLIFRLHFLCHTVKLLLFLFLLHLFKSLLFQKNHLCHNVRHSGFFMYPSVLLHNLRACDIYYNITGS